MRPSDIHTTVVFIATATGETVQSMRIYCPALGQENLQNQCMDLWALNMNFAVDHMLIVMGRCSGQAVWPRKSLPE